MTYFLGNWRFWAGALVSVATLALLVLLVDRRELWHALRTANYLYLAPAIVLYFIGQWFRALRWQYLLSPIARISGQATVSGNHHRVHGEQRAAGAGSESWCGRCTWRAGSRR